MIVNGADVSVSPHIVSKGYYELTEELFLKKILKGGDWTVDVGANIGVFSLLMAHQVGPFGRVFSFEPNPECARLLRKSCVMNWMHERVKVTEAAVGDQADSATLSFHSDRLGDGTVLPAEKQGVFGESIAFVGGAKQINVPIVRLDDEFEVDLPIRFLKIDAEGFEHRILNGASRLIRNRCFDFIMVEVLRDVARHQWVELCAALKLLEEAGYTPHVLIQNGRVTPTSVHAVIHGNTKGGRNFIFKSVDATL
jgi:FkbM family methyltransferase